MKQLKQIGFGISSLLLLAALTRNSPVLPRLHASPNSFASLASIPADGTDRVAAKKKIRLAILLDTSGSMDGLIDQAKSQLWNIVNEMGKATVNGKTPELEIALYQYGNDGISAKAGFIRQETPFTSQLDLVSEKLFALRTNGGSEFCGQAIYRSLDELEWGGDAGDYKAIFIAGNEPFSQGNISPDEALARAGNGGIFVNAIYCGPIDAGLKEGWDLSQRKSRGGFLNIDSDQKTVYIETPYDQQISALNGQLNDTYVWYGEAGEMNYDNMNVQDNNAAVYGMGNRVNRALAKNSSNYQTRNHSWDLVDRLNTDTKFDLGTVKNQHLPEVMRGMSTAEKREYVAAKQQQRAAINQQISDLGLLRDRYIRAERTKLGDQASLENAMLGVIQDQALSKGFAFASTAMDARKEQFAASLADMDYFLELAQEVKEIRKDRLVNFNQFLEMAADPNTVILDARGQAHFDAMHLRGAIHLDYAAFNAYDLARLIPNKDTRILIYCNNNIDTDSPNGFSGIVSPRLRLDIQRNLVSKGAPARPLGNASLQQADNYSGAEVDPHKTLALNIPTFINLHGYGYTNVYELNELVSPNDPRLVLEGNAIPASWSRRGR
ncbi:MAG: rhodanese-like domain-containing protein [Bacteroidota bacterium]